MVWLFLGPLAFVVACILIYIGVVLSTISVSLDRLAQHHERFEPPAPE